jgi:aspartate beta-hydroxylase
MTTSDQDAQAGIDHLRAGNAAAARDALFRAVQGGRADNAVLLGLARACRQLGDAGGAAAALDHLLKTEPRNLVALLARADLYDAAGDTRAASAFYSMALRIAPPPSQLSASVFQDLRRAEATLERYSSGYRSFLQSRLAAGGFDPETSSPRFRDSVDIVLGERQIYVQQPKYYYFPYLPQIQFYDRAQFPWMDRLEAATDEIRAELLEVMRQPDAFAPYVQGTPNRPRKDEAGMLDNPAWSAFYLWKNGAPVPGNVERCPRTMAALEGAPLARVQGRSPSILFSLLTPGAHIPPHHGLVNTRLICHLPLLVPGKCTFRVGSEVRDWAEGKAWAFDDTIEHEAWNRSAGTRVILLFDIWRPELTAEERSHVVSLFEAIDAHSGKPPEWEI